MTNFKTNPSRRQWLALTATVCAALSFGAQAQSTWPAKPVTLVVPFPAGGGTDAFARHLATQLTKQLGKQIIIDNRGGAGGTLGASIAAKAAPDGYTFFVGAAHHAIAPAMYPNLDYDFEKSFIPVAMIANPPQVIVVNPKNVQVKDLKEFIELLKKNPGKYSIGSAGIGSFGHVMSEVIKTRTGTFMVHIPYRGGAQIISDLISGQIDFAVTTLATAAAMISSKRVKVLGVSSKERVPLVKDVATFGESQALKGVDMLVWAVLFAPPGTPDAVVQKMNQAIVQVNALPSMKALVLKLGSELPPSLTPAQTREYLKAQRELYQDAASRIQPE